MSCVGVDRYGLPERAATYLRDFKYRADPGIASRLRSMEVVEKAVQGRSVWDASVEYGGVDRRVRL